MAYTEPALTYTNNLGPICIAKSFTSKDPAPDHTDLLLDNLETWIAFARKTSTTARMWLEASDGFPKYDNRPGVMFVPYNYANQKGEVEEFLSVIEENLAKLNSLKDTLTRLNGRNEASVINAFNTMSSETTQSIQASESKLPEVRKLLTPSPAAAIKVVLKQYDGLEAAIAAAAGHLAA